MSYNKSKKLKIGWWVTTIVAASLGIMSFSISFIQNLVEINTKVISGRVMESATEMENIASRAGNTVNESYFQKHGAFLQAQAKIDNANIRINTRKANNLNLAGIILCICLIAISVDKIKIIKLEVDGATLGEITAKSINDLSFLKNASIVDF